MPGDRIQPHSYIFMKQTLTSLLLLATTLLPLGCTQPTTAVDEDPARFVNPFIGAADNGHTFPGACCPFGMIQTSPVTGAVGWRYCSEYVYTDSLVWGFTQTHLNGTGCMDLGDILVMPTNGERVRSWNGYRSRMDKAKETAEPGYYSTWLTDAGIRAELTATTRVALHRYTFEQADSASVLIDLQHGPAWNENQYHSHVSLCQLNWENNHTLTGHIKNSVWVKQDYFFVLQFDRPVVKSTELVPATASEVGRRIVATFDLKPGEELMMKLALSTTGIEGARLNLESELPDWDFEATRIAARKQWNDHLTRIQVTGTDEEKTNFYTAMYHALIQPNQLSDVDGRYRNAADSVVTAGAGVFYSTFSLWDTYRAAHPLYTLIVPERVDGFVSSLVEQGEVQGYLPIWALWGKENHCMIGNHGVAVIAEAHRKGFNGFDLERAWQMVKRTQTVSHPLKSHWEIYDRYGYFPTDLVEAESVSSTLESVYDDYAAAQMASRMGRTEEAAFFARRAEYYKNLFDPQTRFMRPRLSDGSWKTPFDPNQVGHSESVGGDYTEGNAWQYTWHVQHDVPGLVSLFGGNERFLSRLDSVFTVKLETAQADVTGLIGQYAHGNEPSHHVAYLYALAGKPERTQELVRQIFTTQYHARPDGLCGNDDCGQMSAWYMFAAMGFYPVDPVSGHYVLGAPQLPRLTLSLPYGKTFTVVAEGISPTHKYVESIELNGRKLTTPTISHEEILQGGTLVFRMKE